MSDERLEAAARRLTREMRERIAAKAQEGTLPVPVAEAIGSVEAIAAGASPLERELPVPALEAIIQRTGRPPLLIRNDKVELEPGDLFDFAPNTDAKVRNLERWIPSVGRVEFLNHRMSWGGTGWVVDTQGKNFLLVTNRHVAKLVAKRIANGSAVFLRSAAGPRYGMQIDFKEEYESVAGDPVRTVPVAAVTYLADDLAADMAVLRVDAPDITLSPVNLAARPAKVGEQVALIGYPAFDSRNDVNDQARYFRDLYEVKRLAPGKVMQALSGATTLTHDCTSLGGNSGSPLFELEGGTVVGLHFSGLYGVANTAVGIATIKKVLKGIPTVVPVTGKTEGLADGHHDAAHFAVRRGFATDFLKGGAVATPWPGLPPEIEGGLAKPSDGPDEPGELRYTHFGVKYSSALKLPMMTAVNIDGARAVRIKRGQDKWFTDGRIDRDVQLGAGNFGDAEIDRGHMVRREDPNWGTDEEARRANDDTFHYVNAAAQHSRLNQGKTLWQGLENYILDNSRIHGFQACVFTGPVIGPDTEDLDGAAVPMEFWKLVATLDAGGQQLRATAYLLSQGQLIRDLMERRSRTEAMEGVVLGEYRTFQIAIADLAEATGYDFSAYAGADPLAPGAEESADRSPRFVAIDAPEDLIL